MTNVHQRVPTAEEMQALTLGIPDLYAGVAEDHPDVARGGLHQAMSALLSHEVVLAETVFEAGFNGMRPEGRPVLTAAVRRMLVETAFVSYVEGNISADPDMTTDEKVQLGGLVNNEGQGD